MTWQSIKKIIWLSCSVLLLGCQIAPTESARVMADTDIALAMYYLQHQQNDIANHYLVVAAKQTPNDPLLWMSKAYYQEKIGNNTAAAQYYQHAIQLAPHLGAPHNNYGVFLCQQHHFAQAMQQFKLAQTTPGYEHAQQSNKNAMLCKQLKNNHDDSA